MKYTDPRGISNKDIYHSIRTKIFPNAQVDRSNLKVFVDSKISENVSFRIPWITDENAILNDIQVNNATGRNGADISFLRMTVLDIVKLRAICNIVQY